MIQDITDTISGGGVNYDRLDPWKVAALEEARGTAGNIERLGFTEIPESRGQSVYLVERRDFILAHVEEGLGTKNLVADAVHELTGRHYYHPIGQCAAATILNDLATSGANPLTLMMHLAAGDDDWFKDDKRAAQLASGWRLAADTVGCSWGGGETPALSGIVVPGTIELSGSATGIIEPKSRQIQGIVTPGDAIVLFESSGIHANGLTLARAIGEEQGYLSVLSDGRTYGETLLDPTILYSPVVSAVQKAGVTINYAINITGHGWRKLMRADGEFRYCISNIPDPQPVFDFIQEHGRHGGVSDYDMYGAYNMGAGFALVVNRFAATTVLRAAERSGIHAWVGGTVELGDGEKAVVIEPLDLHYGESTLNLS